MPENKNRDDRPKTPSDYDKNQEPGQKLSFFVSQEHFRLLKLLVTCTYGTQQTVVEKALEMHRDDLESKGLLRKDIPNKVLEKEPRKPRK